MRHGRTLAFLAMFNLVLVTPSLLADVIPTFGLVNMIGGEFDR